VGRCSGSQVRWGPVGFARLHVPPHVLISPATRPLSSPCTRLHPSVQKNTRARTSKRAAQISHANLHRPGSCSCAHIGRSLIARKLSSWAHFQCMPNLPCLLCSGSDQDLVLHGGGNTSVKAPFRDIFGNDIPALYVKGSGWDLASIEKEGFAPVRPRPRHALPPWRAAMPYNVSYFMLFSCAGHT